MKNRLYCYLTVLFGIISVTSVALTFKAEASVSYKKDFVYNTDSFVTEYTEPIEKYVGWNFYSYDFPSFFATKKNIFEKQNVIVYAETSDGWILIDTFEGMKWIYADSNTFFIENSITIFEQKTLGSNSLRIAPQVITVLSDEGNEWYSINTWLGERWVNRSYRNTYYKVTAPVYNQKLSYPDGCEAFAATMCLNALGIDILPEEFIAYIPQNITKKEEISNKKIWGDPDEEFVGDMKDGYIANPIVIEKAINENMSDKVFAKDVTGADYGEIVDLLDKGGFVCIWYHPSGKIVRSPDKWYTPAGKQINADFGSHTVAVLGYDTKKNTVFIGDSLEGTIREVPWSIIHKTYSPIGRKALYLNSVKNQLHDLEFTE